MNISSWLHLQHAAGGASEGKGRRMRMRGRSRVASCEQQAGAQAQAARTKFKSKIQFFAQAEKSNHCQAQKKVKGEDKI